MITRVFAAYTLAQALAMEGFDVPKNVIDIEIESKVDDVMVLKYRVMLEQEDLVKIGKALTRMGEQR